MSLNTISSVFFIGIKGVAQANLAIIAAQMGNKVGGWDTEDKQITDPLLQKNRIVVETNPNCDTKDFELVVYSGAHGGSANPIVLAAKNRGVATMHQAAFIQALIELFPTSIAVSGCHGKTTTASLLVYMLKNLGCNASWLVGVPEFSGLPGGRFDVKSEVFVFECDEYGLEPPADTTPKLTLYSPTHAICTNIDFDHPDVYENLDHTKRVFKQFFEKILTKKVESTNARLFLCADDEPLMEVASELPKNSYQTFGFEETVSLSAGADIMAACPLPGKKNVSNFTGVCLTLENLGYERAQILASAKGFSGVKRRLEQMGEQNGITFYDDYAHHPAEIEATIEAIRTRHPGRRLIILFQSHTFSRTEMLKDRFVEALGEADLVFIDKIFGSARERPSRHSISALDLENLAHENGLMNLYGFDSRELLLAKTRETMKPGDIVVTMGAGDIYKLHNELN